MFCSALLCGLATLTVFGGMDVPSALLVCAPTAAVSATTELASKDGNDTIWVPLATVVVLSLLVRLVSA